MKFFVILILALMSMNGFPQDSLKNKLTVELILTQRDYNERIDNLRLNQDEKYAMLNYGLGLKIPILRKEQFIISTELNYIRSFTKKWNISDHKSEMLTVKVNSELYTLKANIGTEIAGFYLSVSAGIHQDNLVLNDTKSSRTEPGYGFSLGYGKPIKIFKTKTILPSIHYYKVKNNQFAWALNYPIYFYPR